MLFWTHIDIWNGSSAATQNTNKLHKIMWQIYILLFSKD